MLPQPVPARLEALDALCPDGPRISIHREYWSHCREELYPEPVRPVVRRFVEDVDLRGFGRCVNSTEEGERPEEPDRRGQLLEGTASLSARLGEQSFTVSQERENAQMEQVGQILTIDEALARFEACL